MAQGDVFSLQCRPRRPERRELSVIKIRSSMPPAAYQRLDANPTIHMQMRFLRSTVVKNRRIVLLKIETQMMYYRWFTRQNLDRCHPGVFLERSWNGDILPIQNSTGGNFKWW